MKLLTTEQRRALEQRLDELRIEECMAKLREKSPAADTKILYRIARASVLRAKFNKNVGGSNGTV